MDRPEVETTPTERGHDHSTSSADHTTPHKHRTDRHLFFAHGHNISEIVEALNISSSASIKYGTIKGAGSASIVNENKVNQSDLNYIVTVKVTNETSPVADKMTFNPVPELDNTKFTDVFGRRNDTMFARQCNGILIMAGDCFISGITEGGEFSAIISIKVSDKSKISAVKAAAEAEIAIAAAPGLLVGTSQSMDKHKSDVWDDTKATISVNWAGGGDIKPPETGPCDRGLGRYTIPSSRRDMRATDIYNLDKIHKSSKFQRNECQERSARPLQDPRLRSLLPLHPRSLQRLFGIQKSMGGLDGHDEASRAIQRKRPEHRCLKSYQIDT